jgi:hypothetical protein
MRNAAPTARPLAPSVRRGVGVVAEHGLGEHRYSDWLLRTIMVGAWVC